MRRKTTPVEFEEGEGRAAPASRKRGGPMRWWIVEGGEEASWVEGWCAAEFLSGDILGGMSSRKTQLFFYSRCIKVDQEVLCLSYERGCSGQCQNTHFWNSSLDDSYCFNKLRGKL